MTKVTLTVNGSVLSAEIEPRTHLADLLRETHNLTGTHIGCEHGVCGACTLLVDDVPIRSCITFAVACENAKVTTIEGLDEDEIAGELRAAFTTHHALQCGYCSPGMIVSARDVVLRMEAPTEHEIRVAMSGNLCRCTGYVGIVRAIQSVISDRRARGVAAVPGGGRELLGPAGSGRAGEMREASAAPVASAASRAAPRTVAAGAAARVEADWRPQVEFGQSFVIAHPVEEVWAFFGRVEDVAACLPGAALDGGEKDGAVTGKIKVKVGPISAEFNGVAQITRDEEMRQRRDPGFRPRHPQQLRDARQDHLFRQAGRAQRRLPRRRGDWLHADGNAGAIQPHKLGPGFGEPSHGRLRRRISRRAFRLRRTATPRSRLLWSANLTLVR